MSIQTIFSTVLPISLGIIMLGFGLSLSIEDFKRIAKYPKSVGVGLFCQMGIIPFIAYGVCKVFGLSNELSIGVMILAASPGGVAANIFSHLSHGDVALNLTLTAINSVLSAFTLPLIVNLAGALFAGDGLEVGLQFRKTIEVFLIVIVPVTVGMGVRAWQPAFANQMDRPVRLFSIFVLAAIIVGAIVKEYRLLLDSLSSLGAAMLVFNLASMLIGYVVPKLARLNDKEATAIAMEVGIHNSTIAIYIALSVLGSFTLGLPAAIYSLIMFVTATIVSLLLLQKNKTSAGG